MNKLVSLSVKLLPALALSATTDAGVVLSAGSKCFQVGQSVPGAMNKVIKLHTNKALTDRRGDLVQVNALERGFKATNPPETFTTELSGTATFIKEGTPSSILNKTQIHLGGGHFGTDDGQEGLWSENLSLSLDRQSQGKIAGGIFVGFTVFDPLVAVSGATPTRFTDNTSLTPISCDDF